LHPGSPLPSEQDAIAERNARKARTRTGVEHIRARAFVQPARYRPTVTARRALLYACLVATAAACSGGVGSIGAVLGRDNDSGALYIRDVPPGMAAAKAGLVPGDRLLMIDGVYVNQLDAKEIRAKLRGDIGSSVELTVVHGGEVKRVKLTRTELKEHEIKPKETRVPE
jgi:C-terminal processing protease CtpA/Prc